MLESLRLYRHNIFKNQKIFIYNRNYKKLLNFTSKLKNKNIENLRLRLNFNLTKVDLIVNATSVGFNLWQNNKKGYFNLSCFSLLETQVDCILLKVKI